MTTTSTLDIIVPVWNRPVETRACLVSILESTDTARLFIINNGCDRTTELMLEEFSDHLGERAIYMTMERNVGFVPAVNRALVRSNADWALIVRPTGLLTAQCLQQLEAAATQQHAGIITPSCPAEYQLPRHLLKYHCSSIETTEIGFSVLGLAKEMRDSIGLFDEELDGGPWCLRDYRHRADSHGFLTLLLPLVSVAGEPTTLLGSLERRRRLDETAAAVFQQRWGSQQHFAVYLPKETEEQKLSCTLELLLSAARRGHRFELFLHRRQYKLAVQRGAGCLHSGIVLRRLSPLTPLNSLARGMEELRQKNPQLQPVCGLDGIPFPGYDAALSSEILLQLSTSTP